MVGRAEAFVRHRQVNAHLGSGYVYVNDLQITPVWSWRNKAVVACDWEYVEAWPRTVFADPKRVRDEHATALVSAVRHVTGSSHGYVYGRRCRQEKGGEEEEAAATLAAADGLMQ